MEKPNNCGCRTGCFNNRCSCLKFLESCDIKCKCVNCHNPLNDIKIENFSICALQNINTVKNLSEKQLEVKYELPCGCCKINLSSLLKEYYCKECSNYYLFSFCWNNVVQVNDTWHCYLCNQCRDWREWHCENCNRCTYGRTLSCENCDNSEKSYW